jgi:hypothetical protein
MNIPESLASSRAGLVFCSQGNQWEFLERIEVPKEIGESSSFVDSEQS